MHCLKSILTGLLYIAVVRIENTRAQGSQCVSSGSKANCSSKGFKDIPQDLDMALTDLDASHNPIEHLNDDVFKRYPSLSKLRLRSLVPDNGSEVICDSNVFSPLKDLVVLDLGESAINIHSKPIIWPTKLKILSVGGLRDSKFHNLTLLNLNHLEELNASSNRLASFPEFHPEAPLHWIDLIDNPLENMTAEHLAPYCTLAYLRLRIKGSSKLISPIPEYSCQCRRLEQWMIMQSISGFEFTCLKPKGEDYCQVKNFSNTMWNQRNACLARLPTSRFWKWLIICTLLSLIVPIAFGAYQYYKYYKRKKGISNGASATVSDNAATSPSTEESLNSIPDSNKDS